MSELVKEHGVTKLLNLYILISAIVFLSLITLVPSPEYQLHMRKEVKSLASLLNTKSWEDITNNVGMYYQKYYIASGLQDDINTALLPHGEYKTKAIIDKFKLNPYLNRAANNLHIMAYQIVYRCYIMMYWLWVLVPTLLALVYDGMMRRKIRQYEPEQISIKGSRFWTRGMVYLFIISFSYLVVPNWFGPISAAFPLIVLVAFGLAVRFAIQNYMKVA